jgi:hypothetical protein
VYKKIPARKIPPRNPEYEKAVRKANQEGEEKLRQSARELEALRQKQEAERQKEEAERQKREAEKKGFCPWKRKRFIFISPTVEGEDVPSHTPEPKTPSFTHSSP